MTKLTGVGALLAVPSFEALPFMARYAVLVSTALGPDQMPSVLATVLAGSLAVSLLASATTVSHPRPRPRPRPCPRPRSHSNP